ncbi:MAG: TVP38/TMEM64 family protein [Deltaproteobacteria bacterium]|nr:TVP38/TMEM64 family protein [Candidatus Zymogenaceae bacterium]
MQHGKNDEGGGQDIGLGVPSKLTVGFVLRELRGVFIFIAVISAVYVGFRFSPWYGAFTVAEFDEHLRSLGYLAMPIHIVCFVILPLFIFPITPLCVAGGVLFGTGLGFVISAVGYILNSWAGFLISKSMFRKRIERLVRGRGMDIDKGIASHGILSTFLIRFFPFTPAGFQNYLVGLSGVGFRHFTIGSILGGIPWVFVLVFIGGAFFTDRASVFLSSILLFLFICVVSLIITFYNRDKILGKTSKNGHSHVRTHNEERT